MAPTRPGTLRDRDISHGNIRPTSTASMEFGYGNIPTQTSATSREYNLASAHSKVGSALDLYPTYMQPDVTDAGFAEAMVIRDRRKGHLKVHDYSYTNPPREQTLDDAMEQDDGGYGGFFGFVSSALDGITGMKDMTKEFTTNVSDDLLPQVGTITSQNYQEMGLDEKYADKIGSFAQASTDVGVPAGVAIAGAMGAATVGGAATLTGLAVLPGVTGASMGAMSAGMTAAEVAGAAITANAVKGVISS